MQADAYNFAFRSHHLIRFRGRFAPELDAVISEQLCFKPLRYTACSSRARWPDSRGLRPPAAGPLLGSPLVRSGRPAGCLLEGLSGLSWNALERTGLFENILEGSWKSCRVLQAAENYILGSLKIVNFGVPGGPGEVQIGPQRPLEPILELLQLLEAS